MKPSYSGLFSDTFGNIGILADWSFSDHETRANHVNIQGWEGRNNATTFASTVAGTNMTQPVWFIQDYGIYQENTEDKRTDGRLVLQYQASDNLLVTLNGDYSNDRITQLQNGYSVWFNNGSMQNVQLNQNGTVTNFVQPNTPTDFQGQLNGQRILNEEYGLKR